MEAVPEQAFHGVDSTALVGIIHSGDIQLDPEGIKGLTYGLKVLRAAAGLANMSEAYESVKAMVLAVRCVSLLSVNPNQLLNKIGSSFTDSSSSISDFIINCKKLTDVLVKPPKMILALAKYGMVSPSVTTFLTPRP